MIKKYNSILIIVCIFILIIGVLGFTNYYNGLTFKKCTQCESNKIYLVDIKSPPQNIIHYLENQFQDNSIHLDPKYNLNSVQGKKINYINLPEQIKTFYESSSLIQDISKILNEKVSYADKNEKYRIFARIYDNENDFINWHYDNNFTKGKRYTLVIPLLLSENNTSDFMIKDQKTELEKKINIPLGKGVLYDGSSTYHKISYQTKNEKRMVIVIPLYTKYEKNFIGEWREKIRNITYKLFKV